MTCASILLGLVAALAPAPAPRKMPLTLAEITDQATFVCIGRVEELVDVPVPRMPWYCEAQQMRNDPSEVRIARIAVERVLKGDPATTCAYQEAWRTWTCDDTKVEIGQRCLYFLAPGQVASAPEAIREAVHRSLGSDAVLRNVGSGDGILPIYSYEGEEYAIVLYSPPQWMARSRIRPGIQLPEVLGYVDDLARFAHERLAIHMKSVGLDTGLIGQSKPFDLRILPDGSTRIEGAIEGKGQFLRVSRLEAGDWWALQESLRLVLGSSTRNAGSFGNRWARRSLSVRLEGASLEFSELEPLAPDASLGDGERADHVAALRAWAAIRGAIDCPECADHREIDRAWLER